MAGESDLLIARLALATRARFRKNSVANQTAGAVSDLYRAPSGLIPAQPVIPAAAAIQTNTTAGYFAFVNAGAGKKRRIAAGFATNTVSGIFSLVDNIIRSGGLNGTLATAQAVNTPAIPAARGAINGDGLEWYLTCYTDLGATGVTATITYTDQAGNTGNTTTVAIPATWRAGRALLITPSGGDSSIASIQSVTLSATTGAAGSFGVLCVRNICDFGTNLANGEALADALRVGFAEIFNDSALSLLFIPTGTTSGDILGSFSFIEWDT